MIGDSFVGSCVDKCDWMCTCICIYSCTIIIRAYRKFGLSMAFSPRPMLELLSRSLVRDQPIQSFSSHLNQGVEYHTEADSSGWALHVTSYRLRESLTCVYIEHILEPACFHKYFSYIYINSTFTSFPNVWHFLIYSHLTWLTLLLIYRTTYSTICQYLYNTVLILTILFIWCFFLTWLNGCYR